LKELSYVLFERTSYFDTDVTPLTFVMFTDRKLVRVAVKE